MTWNSQLVYPVYKDGKLIKVYLRHGNAINACVGDGYTYRICKLMEV